jgi:predicted naringenin-chalcone synthase
MACLFHFHSIRPPYESKQEDTLDWLVEAHVESQRALGLSKKELALFRENLDRRFRHVGAKPQQIAKRGHILADFLHREWDKMEVFKLREFPAGQDLSVRLKYFEAFVDQVFDAYYPDGATAPDDLIHVSCTGYLSPSGAQKLVSKRGWGAVTTVTHAYHMGCYGAFPSIRMGDGFLRSGKKTIDIIHTEICSIHSNPSLHNSDQLVSQSLFADGFMKYSLSQDTSAPHLKTLAVHEEIIPDSIECMTWHVVDWGNQISLAQEVPSRIARALPGYLKTLSEKACVAEGFKKALFAIHPGGPKILEQIQERFDLTDQQMSYSYEIMKNYGNMSSATLPHIWEKVLADKAVEGGSLLVSLAFGPGLSISGSIMVKACGA